MPAYKKDLKEREEGMEIAEEILDKFEGMGYRDVSVNLWHGVRLYVNIKGEKSFCYHMEERCRIVSGQHLLGRRLFDDARRLCYFLQNNRNRVLAEMGDGAYHRRKAAA